MAPVVGSVRAAVMVPALVAMLRARSAGMAVAGEDGG